MSTVWNGLPWPGSASGPVKVLAAVAARENVIRVELDQAVYFSTLLEAYDASDPSHYAVTAVTTATGYDGDSSRAVGVAAVEEVPADELPSSPAGAFGAFLDLVLDRPMTPWPSSYSLVVTGLKSADLSRSMSGGANTATVQGLFRELVPPDPTRAHPARDMANPQTLSALREAGQHDPLPTTPLASFRVDDSGDYAFDEGLVGLKKRIYRRLVTVVGGFAHLGENYGVGIPSHGKRLALASVLGRLSAAAEAQIAREPEVARVRVKVSSNNTGLVRFSVLVRTRAGVLARFDAPFLVK